MKFYIGIFMSLIFALPVTAYCSYENNSQITVSRLQILRGNKERFVNASHSPKTHNLSSDNGQRESVTDTRYRRVKKNELVLVGENVRQPSQAGGYSGGRRNDNDRVSLLSEDVETLGEDDNLFGLKRGYFHPYVSGHFAYTDNLFNLYEDKTTNFLTKISPGIWLSVPRRKAEPVAIASHNSSGGGLQYMLDDYEGTDRYELYFNGGFDYSKYSADSNLNDFEWAVEGMGRYNFPGGLTLQLMDQYVRNRDRYEVGYPDSNLLHLFYSNVLVGTAEWRITEKFRVKGDVSLFSLRYDEDAFDYLERDDFFVDLYGYFNLSEITSFFVNYKYGLIGYDSYTQYDNRQNLIYGGLKWSSTEKIALSTKIGIQDKQFSNEDSTFTDYSGLALELQIDYRYSEKTQVQFNLYKKNEESDSLQAQDKNVLGALFVYNQDYTEKLHGSFSARYENADYTELGGQPRDEWRIVLEPKLRFAFREWINVELGYQFEKRDSTDDTYDYSSNTVFANLNLEL